MMRKKHMCGNFFTLALFFIRSNFVTSSLSWLWLHSPYKHLSESDAEACNSECRAQIASQFVCAGLPHGRRPKMPPCNASESNARWKYSESRFVACTGPYGRVECVKGSHCEAFNLWPPIHSSPSNCALGAAGQLEKRPMIRTGCMWTVYCKRQRLSREEEHQVNLFFGRGSGKREAWPPVAFRDAMPAAAATLSPFPAYLARRGDCGGIAANPAHCQSDPVNFYAITRNLKEKPVVFLGSGYNYGDKQHAWGSAKSSLLQNTTLWCVWQAGAKAIGILERPHLSQENLFQNDNWLPNGFNVIPQAIFSPPSMGAIWGPTNCKAQILSPVLANLRSKVDDYIERLAGAPPISAYTAVKSNKGFILFALRAPLASTNNNNDHRRLEKENPGRRSIHNFAQLIDATKRKWPDLEIRVHLFSESTSYPLQVALWRRARIVVGLHGGALSGSLWLSPGQGLLEITPREKSCGFPGMFAHVTAAVGARYHGILCQSCSMRNGGSVDENLFIETLSSLLQKTTTPSLHHKNQ